MRPDERLPFLSLVAVLALLAPLASGVHAGQAVLPSTVHEAGVIRQGERLAHVFRVRNAGSVSLSLELVALTQPGLTARFPPTIPPSEEGRVRLEWDTSRARGPVEGVAVVRLSDPDQPEARFALKAVVQPPIEFQPFAAIFVSAFQGEPVQRSLRIVNHEERPLKILGVESSSERFIASIEPLAAGETYELVVRTRLNPPLGRAEEPLYVLTDHPTRSRLKVLVHTLVKASVYVNPETVEFGHVSLTDLAGRPGVVSLLSQVFFLKTREESIAITAVSTDLEMLEIRQVPPDGERNAFRFEVGLNPARLQPGRIAGTIRISTSHPTFPALTLPVRGEIR